MASSFGRGLPENPSKLSGLSLSCRSTPFSRALRSTRAHSESRHYLQTSAEPTSASAYKTRMLREEREHALSARKQSGGQPDGSTIPAGLCHECGVLEAPGGAKLTQSPAPQRSNQGRTHTRLIGTDFCGFVQAISSIASAIRHRRPSASA